MADGRTLWELIVSRALETPDARLAIDEEGRSLTFAGYRDACEAAAAGLAALGVGEGMNVSWQLPTWNESLVLVGALSRLGAVQNPILPIYRSREVGFVCTQTGARLLVVPSEWKGFAFKQMADEIAAGLDHLEVLVCDRRLPTGDPSTLPAPPAADGEPPVRWLFYTSGTTADPKGAKHTDGTIISCARGMNAALALEPDDKAPLVFPFTHIGGITWLVSALLVGLETIVVEAFVPDATIAIMQQHGATIAGAGTPFHLAYLAAQRAHGAGSILPTVRVFPGGGAPKPPQLHYDLKAEIGGVGICSGYGLTECPILAMGAVTDTDEQLANTEGAATPGVDIKVVGLDGLVRERGEEGELCVTAPQLYKGYLDSSLDADAFDDEGYFRTGDLGVVDELGYVRITGRVKDIIIRKGENISAKEVEDLLYTHPKVGDVAVIGLPDPASGERACAVISCKDADDPIAFAEMQAFLREAGLMVQKIPEQLELVDSVPRNPTGKILKHQLRERYAAEASA